MLLARREEYDADVGTFGTQATRRFHAVKTGHADVEEHEIVGLSIKALQKRFGRIEEVKLHDGCFLRPISREHLRQIATRRLAHLFLIIDNSNAHPFPPFCFRMTPSFI